MVERGWKQSSPRHHNDSRAGLERGAGRRCGRTARARRADVARRPGRSPILTRENGLLEALDAEFLDPTRSSP